MHGCVFPGLAVLCWKTRGCRACVALRCVRAVHVWCMRLMSSLALRLTCGVCRRIIITIFAEHGFVDWHEHAIEQFAYSMH